MKQIALLEVTPDKPSSGVLLRAFKKTHGILTYRTRGFLRDDRPWIALLPFDSDQRKDIATIISESARLYEECGQVSESTGELSAVRTLCQNMKIPCPL